MTREIIFRAWDKKRNEWHYFVISPTKENMDYTTSFVSAIGIDLMRSCNLDFWGQYTGLKDKNGKQIYEGDIIVSEDEKEEKLIVAFSESKGAWWIKGWYGRPLSTELNCEVIGNVFETPNLIKN